MIRHVNQMDFGFPPPARPEPDYPANARKELGEALAAAQAAIAQPPWDRRKQGYWRVVGPQMSSWLPTAEREEFLAAFMPELDRIEALFERDDNGEA